METLTLKELIKLTENCGLLKEDGEPKTVYFEFGTAIPTELDSWRGSYDLLSLNYKMTGRDDYDGKQEMKANEFIDMCKAAIGQTFTGYKGGEFTMSEHTAVWVDNHGNYTQTGLIGVSGDNWNIYLKTARVEY